MIRALHLLWIVPLCVAFGVTAFALANGASVGDKQIGSDICSGCHHEGSKCEDCPIRTGKI